MVEDENGSWAFFKCVSVDLLDWAAADSVGPPVESGVPEVLGG